MKYFLFTMVIAAIFTQTISAQKSAFGFSAGIVNANYSATSEGMTISASSKLGLTFGVMAKLPLTASLSFQPAMNYVQKGAKIDLGGESASIRLNYLEMPLNLVFNSPENESGQFFFGLGPSLSYGISGKMKAAGQEEKVHFGSGEDDIAKPFELGGNILAGYTFRGGFNVAVNYNRGLNNISTDASTKEHNYYFGLRLGYLLSKKSE